MDFVRSASTQWKVSGHCCFAKKLGVSRQYICDLEHHRRGVSLEMAVKFSRKLGYSEEQFIRLVLQDEADRAGLRFDVEINKRKAAQY